MSRLLVVLPLDGAGANGWSGEMEAVVGQVQVEIERYGRIVEGRTSLESVVLK